MERVVKPVRCILAAVDLGDHSQQVVAQAVRLAHPVRAQVVLLHVVQDLRSLCGFFLTKEPLSVLQQNVRGEAETRLRALFERELAKQPLHAKSVLRQGLPWREVIAAAAEFEADLLVLGAHVAEKPEHRVMGSTVERVLRLAPCPVLLVPGAHTSTPS